MTFFRINKLQFTLGVLFLLAGMMEYIFSRPPGSAYFLIPFQSIAGSLHDRIDPFGSIGFLAPDFFHPLAFALMCMALLPNTLKHRLAICLAWMVADGSLELAQKYGSSLAASIPGTVKNIPIIETVSGYLRFGTFDPFDLMAIVAGTLTAFLIGHLTKGEKNGVPPKQRS
jgi:hypothetical protein